MGRLLPYIILILILLGVLVGGPMWLHQDRYRQQLSEVLTQKLHHKVVVGKLDAGLFPPALKLREVVVLNPTADATLLQAAEITVPLNLSALLHFSLIPQSLTFHNWTAVIHRKVEGSWDWAEWLSPATPLQEQAAWPMASVNLDRGELRAVDLYGPQHQEFIAQIVNSTWDRSRKTITANGVFTNLPAPVKFVFQGTGQFVSTPQWNGVLELTDEGRLWKLDCNVNGPRTQVTGQAAQWRFDTAFSLVRFYGRLPVSAPVASPSTLLHQWDTRFDWQASTLTFSQSASLADGRTESKGVIYFRPDRSQANVDLAIQNVKLQALEVVLWGNAPLEGTVTSLAHLEVALSSNPWSHLSGQGAIDLKAGRYVWPKASIDALAKAHTMRYVLKKFPDFQQNGMPVIEASAHWQARNGTITTDNGYCNLGDIQSALVGKYDAARHGIDANLRVQAHETNKDLLKELPPSYRQNNSIQPMHGHLQGTPAEWYLRATQASKLPPAVVNKLRRAIKGK